MNPAVRWTQGNVIGLVDLVEPPPSRRSGEQLLDDAGAASDRVLALRAAYRASLRPQRAADRPEARAARRARALAELADWAVAVLVVAGGVALWAAAWHLGGQG